MRLKCEDGRVREFRPSMYKNKLGHQVITDARCMECGEEFGCSDTKLLKPKFIKHRCSPKERWGDRNNNKL